MPPIAILLTLAGLVPYVVCGLGAVGQSPDWADRMLALLIDYASLVLAFLGGTYWSLALLPSAAQDRPVHLRLASGAVPLLLGWAALILAQFLASWMALGVLIAGHVATLVMERQTGQHDALPRHHAWLRWTFALVAIAMMTTVLVLRLLGSTIVF